MNLASYLAKNNLKPTTLAARAGVPASTITRILSGARRPLFDTVVKISEATGGEVGLNDFVQVAETAAETAAELAEADCSGSSSDDAPAPHGNDPALSTDEVAR